MAKKKTLNVTDKTEEELLNLGFRWWDEKHELLLVPLKLFNQIPDGTEFTCISGEKAVKGKDPIDDDTRGGLMAYGVKASDALTIFIKKVSQ